MVAKRGLHLPAGHAGLASGASGRPGAAAREDDLNTHAAHLIRPELERALEPVADERRHQALEQKHRAVVLDDLAHG